MLEAFFVRMHRIHDSFFSEFGVETCTTDYVTIPGGEFVDETGAVIPALRFCGTKMPEVKSEYFAL